MRIGILGTGTLATALGGAWARAGHDVVIGGRSHTKACALAAGLGDQVRAVTPAEVVRRRDAVLLAVHWSGIEEILEKAGATAGSLSGTTLIDPTNAVEHGVGVLLNDSAQRIAESAVGAHVVKAFHLFPADYWTRAEFREHPVTVPMCGNHPQALQTAAELVRALGATPVVLGRLSRVRQLEEVAGFVIGLAFAGVDPNSAIPRIPAPIHP